jgi:ketosteroid isomerase-like protein
MEQGALDRWGKGDPQGYLDIMDTDFTYFDPVQEKRLDGLERLKEFLRPFVGKIRIDRYEMIGPKVQHDGNVAVLTFNLVSYNKKSDGSEKVAARWNSTEVYRRTDGNWRIIHSHWSYIKPELRQQSTEAS